MKKIFGEGKVKSKKLFSILLGIIAIISSVVITLAGTSVTMSVKADKGVDVLIAKGQTNADTSSLEANIKSELEKKGISSSKINVNTVDASSSTTAVDKFNWTTHTTPSLSAIETASNGTSVTITGNGNTSISGAGKALVYTIPKDEEEQNFEFTYNVDCGQRFYGAAMLLRVEKSADVLRGYMLAFNNQAGKWYEDIADFEDGGIYEFETKILSNGDGTDRYDFTTLSNITCKMQIPNLPKSGNAVVSVTNKEIRVKVGNIDKKCDISSKPYGAGYGFLAELYASTQKPESGKFQINNLKLTRKSFKDFNDILNEKTWQKDAMKVLVNVADETNSQFSENTRLAKIGSRFINEEIHYIGIGTAQNKNEIETTVAINNGNGKYIANSSILTAGTEIAKYVSEKLNAGSNSKYVIANEAVSVNVTPDSAKNNTKDTEYPDGKWKIEHDDTIYKNSEGKDSKSGIFTDAVISEFTKPGKYKITYANENVAEIYAHRKPISAFTITRTSGSTSIKLEDKSVDADETTGLQTTWKYRKMGDTAWKPGQLSTLEANSSYIIQLEVTDKQGTKSVSSKYVTTEKSSLLPVAEFDIVSKTISSDEKLQIVDHSYDPNGGNIKNKKWVVKKNGSQVYEGENPLLDYSDAGKYGEGNYTISCVVTNESEDKSEEVTRSFTVIKDNIPPEVNVDKESGETSNGMINVKVSVTDDKSGIKGFEYALTATKEEVPTKWIEKNSSSQNSNTFSDVASIMQAGTWYLKVRATDMAGNVSQVKTYGPYVVKQGYSMEFTVVDADLKALKGVKLQFKAVDEKGTNLQIEPSTAISDNNGKVVIAGLPLKESTTLEITTLDVPSGYDIADKKIVSLNVANDKIEVNKKYTSEGIDTTVSDDGTKLLAVMSLEKQKFDLKIVTEDENNSSIKLNNAEYTLNYKGQEIAKGKSENGVLILKSPIGIATGIDDDFVLKQVSSAKGYKVTTDTVLKVKFGGDGSFSSISKAIYSNNKQVEIPNSSKPEIIVKNSRENNQGSFEIAASVSESTNMLNKLGGVEFSLKVETSEGLSYTTEAVSSDSKGNMKFTNLYGTGFVKITFMQGNTPDGYVKATTDKYITIENTNGNLKYNLASVTGVFNKIDGKTVNVNLTITKKPVANSIKINVLDRTTNNTGIEGIGFDIYKVVGNTRVAAGVTDENGVLQIDNIGTDGRGDVTYKIVPAQQENVQIPNHMFFTITYDAKGSATGAKLNEAYTGVSIGFSEKNDDEMFRKQTEITVVTSTVADDGKSEFVINVADDQLSKPVEGAKYKVRFKYDGKIKTPIVTTDAAGQAKVAIPETTKIEVTVTPSSVPGGYILDNTPIKFNLVQNSTGDMVPDPNTYDNLTSQDISVVGKKVVLTHKVSSIRNPRIKFNIIKTDETESLLLKGVSFSIKNINSGAEVQGTTGADGSFLSNSLLVNSTESQTFEITETSAPAGYEVPSTPFIIRIDFNEYNNIIQYAGETYLSGEELLVGKSSYNDTVNNEVTFTLKIKNKADKNQNKNFYAIDIEKVDSDGNIVNGTKYDIDVRPYGIGGVLMNDAEITSAVEVPKVELTKSMTTILLTEKQAGIGFGLDDNIKVVTVRGDDGKLSIDHNTSSYDLKQGQSKIWSESITLSDGSTMECVHIRIEAKAPYTVNPGGNQSGNGSGSTGGNQSGNGSGTIGGNQSGDSQDESKNDSLKLLRIEAITEDGKNTAYRTNDANTYEVKILKSYKSVDIKAIAINNKANVAVWVDGTTADAGDIGVKTQTLDLTGAQDTVNVTIEVSSDSGSATYRLKIVREDTNTGSVTEGLELKEVTATNNDSIENAYQVSTTEWEVEVDSSVSKSEITVKTQDENALIAIEKNNTTAKEQKYEVELVNQETKVKFTVYSPDSPSKQEYTLTIKQVDNESENNYPAEEDPDATFVLRLFNKNDSEDWERTIDVYYYDRTRYNWWYCYAKGHLWYLLSGDQRLPVFFKDNGIYGSHASKGFTWLTDYSKIIAEARLVDASGKISESIYESKEFKLNTSANQVYGSHTANFKKDYTNKTVEFTIIQEIPNKNHKKFETSKIMVKFDKDGKVEKGNITQGVDTISMAVGGISANGKIDKIQYEVRKEYWWNIGYKNPSYDYDEIEKYNSIGTNSLYLGELNKPLNNKLGVVIKLKDVDTDDNLNGEFSVLVSEKDSTGDWVQLETLNVNVYDGEGKVYLPDALANRHLRFTITQTKDGTRGSDRFVNKSLTAIETEITLNDEGNIADTREILTPNAKFEKSNSGGNLVEYTVYNERVYNFGIRLKKLDPDGNPLQGVRFNVVANEIVDSVTNTSKKVYETGSALTDENGDVLLKVNLQQPINGQGKTVDFTITEYYVPENYIAYADTDTIKIRVMFTPQGAIATSPELIEDAGEGSVTLSKEFENDTIMYISAEIKDKKIEDKPTFNITNIDSVDNSIKIDGVQYRIISRDKKEYEANNITYNEQVYTTKSAEDGVSTVTMDKGHALRTVIYELREEATSDSYQTNGDIIISVTYDRLGKIVSRPVIEKTPTIDGYDVISIVGNPIGHTTLELNIKHELKPKFLINVYKLETTRGRDIYNVPFIGTSQIKQEDGTYGEVVEEIKSRYNKDTTITSVGFKKEHPGETVLYTIYEEKGDKKVKRGQVEIKFDNYGTVLTGSIVDSNSPKNYLDPNIPIATGDKKIKVRVNVQEFKMNIFLKSIDTSSKYSLNNARFEITNSYNETNDVNVKTDANGTVVEVAGEIYKTETVTYKIKQLEAPADYYLIDDISFDVTFGDNWEITRTNPVREDNKFIITSTVRDQSGIDMEIELYAKPCKREEIKINTVNEENQEQEVEYAEYDIEAIIVSPKTESFTLISNSNNKDINGITDLGPDKKFMNKNVQYTIKQKGVSEQYFKLQEEIRVTVEYDLDGQIKQVNLLKPSDGSVKLVNSTTKESSTTALKLDGGYRFELQVVNLPKTVMQVKNISTENNGATVNNATFKIEEVNKPVEYSDTKQITQDGKVNLYVGGHYRAKEDEEYVEKTYKITNPTPGLEHTVIEDATFTLKFDKDAKIIEAKVDNEKYEDYISFELINKDDKQDDEKEPIDLRIIVKSKPALTIGVQAISKTTDALINGMKYEIRQVSPSVENPSTVVTNANYIAHANLGKTLTNTVCTYEVVEREVGAGYKFIDKDKVIAKFSITFDQNGFITKDSNNQIMTVLQGGDYIELNSEEDSNKSAHYDLDIKIKYEEVDNCILKIRNLSKIDDKVTIKSKFTVTIGNVTAEGETDENGVTTMDLGKRSAQEKGFLTIVQSNVKGSFAPINTIGINITCDESGRIIANSPASSGGYASHNVAYKIVQPTNGIASNIIEIEVYNNPETTFVFENVDQGDDSIKLQGEFVIAQTQGIPEPITVTMDEDGTGATGRGDVPKIESVPKNSSVSYTITQSLSGTPDGYGTSLPIVFTVKYNQNGHVESITNRGNGLSAADGSTVEITRVDEYTVKIKIKSKKQFSITVETVDNYDNNLKLGSSVYVLEKSNRKSITLNTADSTDATYVDWGKARGIIGTNVANSGLDYELTIGVPTTPAGVSQTYFRYYPQKVYIHVTFDTNGNISSATYSDGTKYASSNWEVTTEIVNHVGLKIRIGYIPNVKINVKRTDAANGAGISGRTMQVSSNTMQNGYSRVTTNSNGLSIFAGNNRIVEEGQQVTYSVGETNTAVQYEYEVLPSMQFMVTYDEKGYIRNIEVNEPDVMKVSGIGTRTIEVEILSYRSAKVILHNSDFFSSTSRLAGKYTITSSKGETTIINTQGNGGSGNAPGVPYVLGRVYSGEDVVYTIHNNEAQYGYETLKDIVFIVHYGNDGSITIDPKESSDPDRFVLLGINKTASQRTAHINIEVKSKPALMVEFNVKDKVYDQPIEKIGFEIKDKDTGDSYTVDALTDSNGKLVVPVTIEKENQVKHYGIIHTATHGGYGMLEKPIDLTVEYDTLGTVNQNGTIVISDDFTLQKNYSTDLWKSSRIRGIKINAKMTTKLGIGIIKVDTDTGNKLQGVTFSIKEEELVGGSETNIFGGTTDINGEMTAFTRNIEGKVQKVKYTISEVSPAPGYRMIEDIELEVTFTSTGKVQSVVVNKGLSDTTVDPSNELGSNVSYDLKVMPEGRENVHIQLTIRNDSKIKFRIVNLDTYSKGDDGKPDPNKTSNFIENSEFNVTVSRDGNIVDKYGDDSSNGTPSIKANIPAKKFLVTNKLGETEVVIEGSGLIQVDYSQNKAGTGFRDDSNNKGWIRVTKSQSKYEVKYSADSGNVVYDIDAPKGIITVYIFNENVFELNLSNVDIDNNTAFAQGAKHKIRGYYGELTKSAKEIVDEQLNKVEFNKDFEYEFPSGNEILDLGNTYDYAEKKLVLEIENTNAPAGYTTIKNTYVTIEFDKIGKITKVTNEYGSERLVNQNKITDSDYQAGVFIGFGSLNKWNFKLVKESTSGIRIDGAEFTIDTYLGDTQCVIGKIPTLPDTITTGQISIPGTTTAMENGVYVERGIQSFGDFVFKIDETKPADGYLEAIKGIEIKFTAKTDTSDPKEPRAVISNAESNNENAKVTINEATREIVVTVLNKPQAKLEITNIDEDNLFLQGVEFEIETMIQGDVSSVKKLGKFTTDVSGKLSVVFPVDTVNTYMLVDIYQEKIVGYKAVQQPISLMVRIDQSGIIDASSIRVVSGENKNDGKGGATLKGATVDNIELEVLNIMEEGYKPFELQIIKEDAKNNDIKLENVQFNIKITPEQGVSVYQVAATDKSGMIKIPNIKGEGKIIVELTELIPPAGYVLGETNGYSKITINKTEAFGLEKVDNESTISNWNIDNANRIVTAHIGNQLDSVSIILNKKDSENDMNISGATFEISEDGKTYPLVTTNVDGLAYVILEKKNKAGTYKYEIKEVNVPFGYEGITDPMGFEITYSNDGNIEDIVESGDNVVLAESDQKFAKLDIYNEQKDLGVPKYDIEVINSDKASNSIHIKDSIFKVVVEHEGASPISSSVSMSDESSRTINGINGVGNIDITITEEKTGAGYRADISDKKVLLNRDPKTGRFSILGSDNAYPIYDAQNNKIIIYVTNEKEKGIFSLFINKMDSEGNLITSDNAEFEVEMGNDVKTITTDSNGQAIINPINIPSDGNSFEMTIKETKNPEGFVKVNEDQVIKLNIQNIYGDNEIKSADIISGSAIDIDPISPSNIVVNFTNIKEKDEASMPLYLNARAGSTISQDGGEYRIDDNYVDRVKVKTTIAEFIDNLDSNGTITIYDKNGNLIEDTSKFIGTEMKVVARKGDEEITKIVVVVSDVTGDGKLSALDVAKANLYNLDPTLVKPTMLNETQIKSVDMTGDGKVSALDIARINLANLNQVD